MKTGSKTPWGKAQTVTTITDGLWSVTTAGHGGYKLDRWQNSKVLASVRKPGGWYEEDCEWVHVVLTFPELFSEKEVRDATENLDTEKLLKERAAKFAEDSKDRFVAQAAWGDWHAKVPPGKVGILATRDASEKRYFLVKSEDYAPPYVVSPEKAEPWEGPNP